MAFDPTKNRKGQQIPELPADRRHFSISEVAALLDVSFTWVYNRCVDGRISCGKRGRLTLIPRAEVVRLLQVFGDTARSYYTVKEAAELLDMSIGWVYSACERGQIRCHRTNEEDGRVRIPVSEIERLERELIAQYEGQQPQSS